MWWCRPLSNRIARRRVVSMGAWVEAAVAGLMPFPPKKVFHAPKKDLRGCAPCRQKLLAQMKKEAK